MIRTPLSTRRARIDRWIASLTPLCDVISRRVETLNLGEPALQFGPAFMARTRTHEDRIRRGAVWHVRGLSTGFHVDFHADRIVYEAWSPDRRVCITVGGKATEATVSRDLLAVFIAARIPDVRHLQAARDQILPVTRRESGPLPR